MKKLFVGAAIALASASVFAFQPGMTAVQVNVEVAQRVAGGESLESITAAAQAAGVAPSVLQASLTAAGAAPVAVFNAMVAANYDAGTLLPPTAAGAPGAGGAPNAPASPGGTLAGSPAAPGFSGISGNSFGQSRASTVGGGGRSSVSPS